MAAIDQLRAAELRAARDQARTVLHGHDDTCACRQRHHKLCDEGRRLLHAYWAAESAVTERAASPGQDMLPGFG